MDLTQAVAIDIESNDLLSGMLDFSSFPYKLNRDAKLWCISFCNIGTGEITSLVKEKVTKENIDSILKDYKFIVFHNGVKFDALVLQLFGLIDYKIGWLDESDTLNGREVRFLDTLILSRLLSPDRYGGHSLKVWGERLGEYKDNFRKECIELGIIQKDSPKGAEFKTFSEGMVSYCEQDTKVTSELFKHLLTDIASYPGWKQAIKMEHKLADLAIRRESLGFWFDKDFAIKCVEDLTEKMQELADRVNPILPPKQMNKTTLSKWQAPKNQLTKKGEPTASLKNFAERVGGEIFKVDEDYILQWEGHQIQVPFEGYLRTTEEASISDLDHVKSHLIDLGWVPTEWAIRDLTKDSKKQNLSFEKRLEAFDRWFKATMEGKYQYFRLDDLEGDTVEEKYLNVKEKLNGQFPVRVLTSPKVRVGVEKELCPNLEKLGEKVAFAKDFALYLTYKHRKSSIAGGDLEDVDYDEEYPNTGYLASYREEDGRVPTPAIEIGANTSRYRHIGVCNVARASSIYGKEMRSLFGCGEGAVQLGFDYNSLEARIQAHYCWNYTEGQQLSVSLLASKPLDIHTVTGEKLGISRSDAKSINYMLMYGGSWVKAKKMLNLSDKEAKDLVEKFWNSMPALKELKIDLEEQWINNNKEFIKAIDGRKLNVRSKHSIINLLFQSGGVICAKYVSVFLMQKLEKSGYCIDPFISKPDVCSLIEYHDEQQLYCNPKLFKFKTFNTEKEAKEFKSTWKGSQLSDISEGKSLYVTLPNIVTDYLDQSIKDMEKLLKLNIPLGFDFSVSNNWYGCH